MNKISEVDKIVLEYYDIPYMIEAYKIFFGRYPIFNSENETKEKMEYMMTILTEYNLYKCKKCEINNYVYLNSPKFKIDLLLSKVIELENQECEFEKLCTSNLILDLEKKGIKSISYIIKKYIEKEQIEDETKFLKQLHNILSCRGYVYLLVSSDTKINESLEQKINRTIERIRSRYQEYSYEMIFKILKFISTDLKLIIEKPKQEINFCEVILEAEKQDIEYDNYFGLESKNIYCKKLNK